MVWATGLLWKAWPLWICSRRGTAGRAFLASLIEDFADEWLTKAMFHYRWAYDADIQYASLWIADFGLLGQLKTLATDPTPLAIMRERTQRTESWTRQLDDASGLEGEWYPDNAALPEATVGLLRLASETYLPLLVANAAAAERGDEKFEVKLLGQTYAQAPFGYQGKCLAALRRRFAALDNSSLDEIVPVLEETRCFHYFSWSEKTPSRKNETRCPNDW